MKELINSFYTKLWKSSWKTWNTSSDEHAADNKVNQQHKEEQRNQKERSWQLKTAKIINESDDDDDAECRAP